jgi:hypothetical protein
MSAPAMNVRPAQISTTALIAGSAAAAAIPSERPSRTSADSALTGGESSVSTPMSPSMVRSATALIAVMATQLPKSRCCGAAITGRRRFDDLR